jgi:hypothetical protein
VDEEPDKPPTYDPNRSAIWPTFPPGTRLPARQVRHPWLDWFGLVLVTAALVGVGFLVWWFIETVNHR